MVTFRYAPIALQQARGEGKDVFAKAVPDHHKWLEDNDIAYKVSMFVWPRLPIAAHQVDMVEIDIIIADTAQAVLFRHYSGMIPFEVLFDEKPD